MVILLKDFVTDEMLIEAGFKVRTGEQSIYCAVREGIHGALFIPLQDTAFGNRIIQYNDRGLDFGIRAKEELEFLPSDWWEEVNLPDEIVGRASFNSVEYNQIRAIKTLLKNKLEDNAKLTGTEEELLGRKYEDNLAREILKLLEA